MGYTHTTKAQLRAQLAARLHDTSMVYFVSAELDCYLAESLRTWNVLTAYWREQASFNNMHGAWSAYLTTDTLLGPLYLAYGNSGNKNSAVYLFLNRGF